MTEFSKRVVFTMAGKGGVGKTGVVVALAEWFESNEIPVTLLDLDTENKARGSLKHFYDGTVTKVNIHTPSGLDAFVDHLDDGLPIIWPTWERGPAKSPRTGSIRCTRM
jgi:cellulose biosynthesis protein BcsQ